MDYKPHGVCSQLIHIEVDDEKRIHNVAFTKGCSGNLQGIARLVDEAISRLDGIRCGMKSTSCPDQLAQALKTLR